MEHLARLVDRDLEEVAEPVRAENHDIAVVVVHLAGMGERLLNVLAMDAVPEGSP